MLNQLWKHIAGGTLSYMLGRNKKVEISHETIRNELGGRGAEMYWNSLT